MNYRIIDLCNRLHLYLCDCCGTRMKGWKPQIRYGVPLCVGCATRLSLRPLDDDDEDTVAVTLHLTQDECNALYYYWNVSSELNETFRETGVDLLDVLTNLAYESLSPAIDKWGQEVTQLDEERYY